MSSPLTLPCISIEYSWPSSTPAPLAIPVNPLPSPTKAVALIFPVPEILNPFKLKFCVNDAGELAALLDTNTPPCVDPSPTYICLVSVVYISSPTAKVSAALSALVPRLSCNAI